MSVPSSVPVEKAAGHAVGHAEKSQGIMISFLAVGYLLWQVFPLPQVETLVSVIILIVVGWVMPRVRGSTLWISALLLLIAVGLMLYHDAPLPEWLEAMRVNITLVSIFLFVPLLGIPVRTGGYVEALKIVLSRRMNEPNFLYLGSKLLTHILGVVLNIGSVSIVYQLTEASNIQSPRLVANAINRGFVSSIFWSPYFSAMALILGQLQISWSSIVLYSFGLVFLSFVVSYWIDRPFIQPQRDALGEEVNRGSEDHELKKAKRKVIELFVLLFLMMAVVLLVEIVTSYSMVLIICLVSLLFPLLWCLLSGKGASYAEEFQQHVYVGIPRMKKEIVLFLIAGFFSGAFVYAKLSVYLVGMMNSVFGSFAMGAAFFISILVVLSALIGLHPIVVVTILVTSIKPELIGFSPEYFALLLLGSWGISNTISPATAVNNLLANLLKVDVFELSIPWNYKYVLVMFLLIPIYLKFMGL